MTDAKQLTLTLHGKWYGHYGVAPCPVCQLEARRSQNALSLAYGENGLLVHCKKSNCAFADILAAAGIERKSPTAHLIIATNTHARADRAQIEKRAKQAHRLWQETQPIVGTVAETYLRSRGITCQIPDKLRYHPACWHPTAQRFPALVAHVEGGDGFAVHRTYLSDDGAGKAEVEPAKAMLGATAGGAVRLTDTTGPLVVAEGIETALSLLCGLLHGPATVWAALSTSGIKALTLRSRTRDLIIATDGDQPGREAGDSLATRASALGWKVNLLPAPDGCDWNDVLVGKEAA